MTQRTGGFRKRSRSILRKSPRDRGKVNINLALQTFELNDRVRIIQEPAMHKGMPMPKYKNRVGTVIEIRGNAYVVEVNDINKKKQIISNPIHLKRIIN